MVFWVFTHIFAEKLTYITITHMDIKRNDGTCMTPEELVETEVAMFMEFLKKKGVFSEFVTYNAKHSTFYDDYDCYWVKPFSQLVDDTIENYRRHGRRPIDVGSDLIYAAIDKSLDWESTASGTEFWSDLHEEWQDTFREWVRKNLNK